MTAATLTIRISLGQAEAGPTVPRPGTRALPLARETMQYLRAALGLATIGESTLATIEEGGLWRSPNASVASNLNALFGLGFEPTEFYSPGPRAAAVARDAAFVLGAEVRLVEPGADQAEDANVIF